MNRYTQSRFIRTHVVHFFAILLLALCALVPAQAFALEPFAPQARLSFTFDITTHQLDQEIAPLLAAHNIPGVMYAEVALLNSNETWAMNWDDAKTLRDAYGWEIGNHSITHPDLTTVTAAQLEEEVGGSKAQFTAHGITTTSYASPLGAYNMQTLRVIANHYASHRAAWGGANAWSADSNAYTLKVFEPTPTTTPEEVMQMIDTAAAEGQWLILLFHGVTAGEPGEYEYRLSDLKKIVDYAATSPIRKVTVTEGLALTSEPNLVANPSFETLSGAFATGWTRSDTTVVIDQGNKGIAPNQTRSAKLIGGATEHDIQTGFISVAGDTQYLLSMFQDASNLTAGSYSVWVDEFNANGAWISGQWLGAVSQPYFGTRTYPYSPTSSSVAKVVLRIYTDANSSLTLYVDDVKLQKVLPTAVPPPPPPGDQNLILNHSMEVASGSLPANWATNAWGTTVAAFTYPTSGAQNGTRYVTTQITTAGTGDAKWYPAHIPSGAGQTYTFSDWYQSTVTSTVEVEVLSTDGTRTYLSLGTAPASVAWTQFVNTFTTPANTQSITVYHYINAVGTLSVDNYALGNSTVPPPAQKPVINSFIANPTTVTQGGSSTLSWNIANASTTSINQGIGAVPGTSVSVFPTATTTYTITATNLAGATTAHVTVGVQSVTSIPSGSLVVSTDASSPSYKVVPAHSSDVGMGAFKFRPSGESVTLKRVGLKLANPLTASAGDLLTVKLYVGATEIGRAIFTGSNTSAIATHASGSGEMNYILPVNQDTVVTVKADIAPIGSGQPATSGHLIAIDIDTSGTNTQATGNSSGAVINATGSTATAGVRIFKSMPTFTYSTAGATLVNGVNDLLVLAVTADAHGEIQLNKLTFAIATTTAVLASPTFIGPNGNVASTTSVNLDSKKGNVAVYFDSTTNTSDRVVNAGQTKTFTLRGIVTGVGTSDSSVSTALKADTAFPLLESSTFMGKASVIDAGSNSVWSPSSTTTVTVAGNDWTNGYGLGGCFSTAGLGNNCSARVLHATGAPPPPPTDSIYPAPFTLTAGATKQISISTMVPVSHIPYTLTVNAVVTNYVSGSWSVWVDEFNADGAWISGKWFGANSGNFSGTKTFAYTPTSAQVATAAFATYTEPNSSFVLHVSSATLPSVAPPPPPPPPPTGNLILNGSFETVSGTFADQWTKVGTAGVSIDGASNGIAPNALRSLHVTGGVEERGALSSKITVAPANTYTLSYYLKQTATLNGSAVWVNEYNASDVWIGGQWLGGTYANFTGTKTLTYTPSVGASKAAVLIFAEPGSTLDMYVDGVTLIQL